MVIAASIVHGYKDLKVSQGDLKRPCLLVIKNKKKYIGKYVFPRNPNDFRNNSNIIEGEIPNKNIPDFKKLPRFGFTGLFKFKNYIYCGSWNSIYKINSKNFVLDKIISNRLMCDIHGIFVNKNFIIHALTAKDTIVFTNHKGQIVNFFSISQDLKVFKDKNLLKDDWRFISKQFKGSTGYFHFNYVQYDEKNKEVWITCRNINAFIVVNLLSKKATLRTMNLSTPALIHDGVLFKKQFYFTSIDGKILISKKSKFNVIQHNREKIKDIKKFNRDLIAEIIRLEDKKILKRQPNWCRGIDVTNKHIMVTIDGRYDTKLRFSVIKLNRINFKLIEKYHFNWSEAGEQKYIRYCTGFDVISY